MDNGWRPVDPAPSPCRQLFFWRRHATAALLCRGPADRTDLWLWTDDRFTRHSTEVFPSVRFPERLRSLTVAARDDDEPLLVGLLDDGVVVTTPDEPEREHVLTLTDDRPDAHLVDACWFAGSLYVVAADGTVLTGVGDALHRVCGALPHTERVVSRSWNPQASGSVRYTPALTDVLADPAGGRLLALDDTGGGHTLPGDAMADGWRAVPGHGGGIGLAWDPTGRRVRRLLPGERNRVIPRWLDDWDGPGDQPADETRTVAVVGGSLTYDEAGRRWLLDDHARLLSRAEDAGWTSVPLPLHLPDSVDQKALSSTPRGSLHFTPARWVRENWRLDGEHWAPAPRPSGLRRFTATPEGPAGLATSGAVRLVAPDGATRIAVAAYGELRDRATDDHLDLLHDPYHDRFVCRHGDGSTWWAPDARTEPGSPARWVRLTGGPPQGWGPLCASPAGVYGAVDGELWLLPRSGKWHRVGDAPAGAVAMVAPADRGGLYAVSRDGVAGWRGGSFGTASPLPAGVALPTADQVLHAHDDMVGYDPAGRRLVLLGAGGAWTLPLDALPAADADLPTGAVTPPPRPPRRAARSAYLLELSVEPGGARMAAVFAYPRFAHVVRCCTDLVLTAEGSYEQELALSGGTLHLWVVQEGTLVHGVDLRRHLRPRSGTGDDLERLWHLQRFLDADRDRDRDGEDETAGEGDSEAMGSDALDWDEAVEEHAELLERVSAVGLTLDWRAVGTLVPSLRGPLVGPRGTLLHVAGPHPAPDVPSCLRQGVYLRHGYNDLEGGEHDCPPPGFTDPDDRSTWREPAAAEGDDEDW